jgi:acetyl esterase/lipase
LRSNSRDGACATIGYRRLEANIAQIHDLKAAVRWLRKSRYQNDPESHRSHSASAGGHLVALLGATDNTEFEGSGENHNVSSGCNP